MTEKKGNYTARRFHDPLDDMLDRPISYNPAFKRITGSTVAALMLSQAWYWSKRTSDEDGWFYKTQAEWEDETGLTRQEQETARKNLTERGIMEERLSGIPARLYYRVLKEEIYNLMGVQYAGIPQTCMGDSSIPVRDIPANINMNSEITTEITTPPKEKIKLPEGSGMDWLIAAGADNESLAKVAEKERAEKAISDLWEKCMGYNPLPWWTDKDLKALLRFLLTKTPDEIQTFCKWARRPFSSFGAEKAREKPMRVVELWP